MNKIRYISPSRRYNNNVANITHAALYSMVEAIAKAYPQLDVTHLYANDALYDELQKDVQKYLDRVGIVE